MINLLPLHYRDRLRSTYRFRVVGTFVWGIVVVMIIVNIMLGGFWFLVRTDRLSWGRLKIQAENQTAQVVKKNKAPTNIDNPESLGLAIVKLKQLSNPLNQPTNLLKELLTERGSAVRFKEMTYGKDQTGAVFLSLTGTHTGRQTLVNFVDRLKANHRFSNVDAPLSNFIREGRGEFSINVQAAGRLKEQPE